MFLALLVVPYLVLATALGFIHSDLLELRGATAAALALAIAAVPLALALEYSVHAAAGFRATGRWPRDLTVQPFWRTRLTPTHHLLMVLVAVGEEIVFRQVWIELLERSLGLPLFGALAVSALLYGLNHQFFGGVSVVSKTFTGLVYGGLYVLGGRSLWLPILAHVLQNQALFFLARDRDG